MNWYGTRVDDFRSPLAKLHPPGSTNSCRASWAWTRSGPSSGRAPGQRSKTAGNAIIRLLFDMGARRGEVAGLRYSPTDPDDRDVDLRRGTVRYVGKGGKNNIIAVSNWTLSAIEDYLRVRRKHTHVDVPWLWLGKRGRLTDSGIAQLIRDRGLHAGIPALHAHDFRHAATHHELMGGMNEADVMAKRGWDSPAMLRRYASTTANERMNEATRKLGLGDKV